MTKQKTETEKLMTGDVAPTSGLYAVDHKGCSEVVWLQNGERLPLCPGCGKHSVFLLQEKVQHISEDPDFL